MNLNQTQPDKFQNLRQALHKKKKVNKGLTDPQAIYQFKRGNRTKRIDFIKNSPEAKEFFKWIFSIQKALKLNRYQFVKRINKAGGKVTYQTVKLWAGNNGHTPRDINYKALLKLEREASLITKEVKNLVRETTTELILNSSEVNRIEQEIDFEWIKSGGRLV